MSLAVGFVMGRDVKKDPWAERLVQLTGYLFLAWMISNVIPPTLLVFKIL